MKISLKKNPGEKPLKQIAPGGIFTLGGVFFEKVNGGIHLDNVHGWAVELSEGLLMKFGADRLVVEESGEFVPK
jgi:hypothetical protein